jgi:integrase
MLSLCDAIEEFLTAREAEGVSDKTIETYMERLYPFCKFVDCHRLVKVTPAELDAYLVMLRRRKAKYVNNPYRPPEKGGLSPATIEGIKESLRVFFNWAVDRGLLSKSPAAHLRRRKFARYARVRAMDAENLVKMLAYAKLAALARNPIDIRDLALLAFTADSLARVGEVSAMNIDDVQFDRSFADGNGHVVYEAFVSGKVGGRLVTFSEQTALFMLDWLDVRPEVESPAVFVATCRHHYREQHPRCTACRVYGQRLTTNAISQCFKRIAKRAGVEGKVNPHAIRHLGGIVYAERAGIEVAQEKLGHTTIMTTRMHYVPHNRDRVRAETAKLSFVSNKPVKELE